MNAIDHPPGSPVFEALKERIEAMGYSLLVSEKGLVKRIEWNQPLNFSGNIGDAPMICHEIIGDPYDYSALVRFAERHGIELED